MVDVLSGAPPTSASGWCTRKTACSVINVVYLDFLIVCKELLEKTMHHCILQMDGYHWLNEGFESQMYVQVAIFFHL